MEYVQERVTTLHDLTDPTPPAPTDRAAVVVPMTEREYGGLAAERVLSELERVDPARVVVPLRAGPERAPAFRSWLREFDLRLTTVWCDAPGVDSLLAERGLDGPRGKGRDVWLGIGVALDDGVDHVVVHDGDTTSYSRSDVPRLLFPLARGHEFSKGYYARVEEGRLYGRLFRLFYRPLVRALAAANDDPMLAYLEAFRYALAGEFAATAGLAERLRVQRRWGLEVGTLGEAFSHAGFEGSAQVDLGAYEHDHRSVGGPTGLTDMSADVGAALLRAVEEAGVAPDYDTLGERYVDAADRLVERYAADAAFNGLDYDREGERDQVRRYAASVGPPGEGSRLPPWRSVDLDPASVRAASETALEGRGG
jgi:glucosyl-3-phosphoglycerate synthase